MRNSKVYYSFVCVLVQYSNYLLNIRRLPPVEMTREEGEINIVKYKVFIHVGGMSTLN